LLKNDRQVGQVGQFLAPTPLPLIHSARLVEMVYLPMNDPSMCRQACPRSIGRGTI